ncbi:TRM11 family methyltransferase [Streptococcus gordonii]|uniref:Modification methylase n=2 Tax=Streptococcus gordonii TaxID=1302 RepID=A8AVY3_STRGC|nr:restriction endonuclease subunit M [Streptococcus gordonii]ABV10214.1 modification methylase [Streptococcus gordonii str. Challis substr. CH1]MBZ2138661.1 site-specific DNA-methyltransferase [Streptococcus gordonii]QGS44969.1 modification methylase [Streptococcus gordonii]VEE20703.1 modification methylase [Streptococcus gordonii]VTS21166.1 modification methylase [Streptococcus gordonii]
MSLVDKINKKELNYWDFSDVVSTGIHKISAYPATMVPDMQNELIKLIKSEDKSVQNILDPFHGSGVTLVEGMKNDLTPIGIDINPLANLITLVKLQGVSKNQIKLSNNRIIKLLRKESFEFEIHDFYNINKWYREDFIETFSKIRAAIQKERYKNIRQYYWVCLINILKKYSNTRSSTFKLHVKAQEDIDSMSNDIIEDFIKNIEKSYVFLPSFVQYNKKSLYIGKAEEILSEFADGTVDLICTSPPYGDNSTTVTYGQYSMLPLYWIDKSDLGKFDKQLIANYSSIDSNSLGGNQRVRSNFESSVLNDFLSRIDDKKQNKVKNFVLDYLNVMTELVRVLKVEKYIVLTLGDRRVDNRVVPLSTITTEYLESNGFILEKAITRNIPKKRMPRKVSKVGGDSVESMNQEHVLILKKVENR